MKSRSQIIHDNEEFPGRPKRRFTGASRPDVLQAGEEAVMLVWLMHINHRTRNLTFMVKMELM